MNGENDSDPDVFYDAEADVEGELDDDKKAGEKEEELEVEDGGFMK